MKEFVRRSGILIVALLGGNVAGMLVFPFGLVVHEFVIWPLTFGICAIFAAIGAGWASNLLVPGHTRSRLLPVVGISEATAAVVAIALLALTAFLFPRFPAFASMLGPPVFLLGTGVIFIAMSASWAAWHFRSLESRVGKEIAITIGLVGLAILAFVATLFLAGLFGLAGG